MTRVAANGPPFSRAPQHLLHHVGEEEQQAALRKRRFFRSVVERRSRQGRQIDQCQEMERRVRLTMSRPLDVRRKRWPTAELAERTPPASRRRNQIAGCRWVSSLPRLMFEHSACAPAWRGSAGWLTPARGFSAAEPQFLGNKHSSTIE